MVFYNHERPHQGLENELVESQLAKFSAEDGVKVKSRLGGMLNFKNRRVGFSFLILRARTEILALLQIHRLSLLYFPKDRKADVLKANDILLHTQISTLEPQHLGFDDVLATEDTVESKRKRL